MIPIIWKIMVLNLVIYPLNLHFKLINIGWNYNDDRRCFNLLRQK